MSQTIIFKHEMRTSIKEMSKYFRIEWDIKLKPNYNAKFYFEYNSGNAF